MAERVRPLEVVVRFSTTNADLVIPIENPHAVTVLSLKQKIRGLLADAASTSRLRLIHAGKVLPDNAALFKCLRVTPPPPRDDEIKSAKAKGKQPLRDVSKTVPPARVYIHCSIGDALSPTELAAEAQAAQDADADILVQLPISSIETADSDEAAANASTAIPAPRGFDRLVSAGFTPAEVAALRAQFLAIQAHTHTPDTMPTGADLLALEERWLDNTSGPSAAGGEGAEAGEEAGGLEDMLYGNLIGFFWPIGAMCWLMREDGVWSRRKLIAVLSGFLVNLTFGFLRVMN